MSKIEEALSSLRERENLTDRAIHLAALISSLFKLRAVALALTGDLVYAIYTNCQLAQPLIEFAVMGNPMPPRTRQEVLIGQLEAQGQGWRWNLMEIEIRFNGSFFTPNLPLCRDFQADYGVLKLAPAEDIAADLILSAFHPVRQEAVYIEALHLLKAALASDFVMDWPVLQKLCSGNDYRMSEPLAQMRTAAMRALEDEAKTAQEIKN